MNAAVTNRFIFLHNIIKDPHWYNVQVCDATMLVSYFKAGLIKKLM